MSAHTSHLSRPPISPHSGGMLARTLGLCVWWLTGSLPAQVPAHAVRIDPTTPQQGFSAARHDDIVHVLGVTQAPAAYFVHHARSLDGGRTWPQVEVPIAWASGFFGVVGDGPHLYVALNHAWTGPHVVASHDDGTSWNAPRRVSSSSNVLSVREVLLHAQGNSLAAVWSESVPGIVVANRSIDGGNTWLPTDIRLDGGASTVLNYELVGHGATLHFVWSTTNPTATWYQRSVDGGSTWLAAPQQLSSEIMNFCAGSPTTLVILLGNNTSLRSGDAGLTWQPTGTPTGSAIGLAVHGNRVLQVRSQSGSPVRHTLHVSDDGGVRWVANPFQLPVYRSCSVQPVVTADAWFVHYQFPSDQYYPSGSVIVSDDGLQWRLCSEAAGRAFFAWSDNTLAIGETTTVGNDAWVHVVAGHSRWGRGSAGSGGQVPRLTGQGLPGLGRTFTLQVDQARPTALGAVFGGFDSTVGRPIGAALLYVAQPIVTVPFTTDATGAAVVPVLVPNVVALQGERLVAQAFVVDLGSGDGFAATAAVESWLR